LDEQKKVFIYKVAFYEPTIVEHKANVFYKKVAFYEPTIVEHKANVFNKKLSTRPTFLIKS